ncbi:DUF2920 family protein [Lederbergia wuyishanensis]|uniref:DUF2920 family protein n=1 Tax=Lederbergia wuyishanensis TaxID=1347903 RepID=A0ABU0D8U9_9BACI|nr:DUF2920 family protein [Lederbergia wuyishanensis]MCJ8007613.1 DUF2920 family protein [Lederbergia wuyishanensis]MDQ0344803.1 hypothetical protein [Lederbergia wuyishanensis]
MSKDYKLHWPSHPNIYGGDGLRKFNIYFSEPDQGVNEETGILLLIPGFGGNASSNVYKKMRKNFADQYNLVVVQCDYFGQEFMQGSNSVQMNFSRDELSGIFSSSEIENIFKDGFNGREFIEIGSKYPINLSLKEILNETVDNFNDMGLMQAMDHLTAIYYVINILKDNGLTFNMNKIIAYGHSHGAYLCYLCNAMAPHLFSLLIDNSAWLQPVYLHSSRLLFSKIGNMTLQTEFDYLVRKLEYDADILDLAVIYKKFENSCIIESFHGTTDNLISHIDKKQFCKFINHCSFHEISTPSVDGEIFKSTDHGLDADFLKMFDYVMKNREFDIREIIHPKPVSYQTKKNCYTVQYEEGLPLLTVKSV